MKKNIFEFIDFKVKVAVNLISLFTIFFLIFYGKLVCPFLEGLPFFDFFKILFILYFVEIFLRELLFHFFSSYKEGKSTIRRAYKLSVYLWMIMGVISIGLFETIYNVAIPWHSDLKLLSGYWFLGAGIIAQIEYVVYERAYRKKMRKIDFDIKSFFDTLTQRITEIITIFTIVPGLTLVVMIIRYVYQDNIIPPGVALEVVFLVVSLTTAAIFAAYLYSRQLQKDTDNILTVIDKVREGNLDKVVKNLRTDEIGRISFEMNQMILGLRKQNLIKKAFGHFVSPQIADKFIEEYDIDGTDDVRNKGEKKKLAILMSDLRGFTNFSEGKDPEEVTSILNSYFNEMVEIVESCGGIIDKFMGDGLMAIFGLVETEYSPSTNAVKSAEKMKECLKKINENLNLELKFGVGIHYGEVLAGYLGSKNRLQYTVIGSTVNIASRIEQETKPVDVPDILYSFDVFNELTKDEVFPSVFIKQTAVKGIDKEILLYSIDNKLLKNNLIGST